MENVTLDGAMRDGRHTMAVRVYYEDTDFTGIVYHANYLRFMERGRTNYLRLIGADHRALFEQTEKEAPGFAFVVRSMTIDYLKPARMDDVLDDLDRARGGEGRLDHAAAAMPARRGGAGRGACARRVHLAGPRAADPEAAAHRHEGGSGAVAWPRRSPSRAGIHAFIRGRQDWVPAQRFALDGMPGDDHAALLRACSSV